jgi:hypothetical protein
MGTLAGPTVAAEITKYNTTVEQGRLSEAKRAEAESLRVHLQDGTARRASRDSLLAAIPVKSLRRASDAELIQGIGLAQSVTDDTIGNRWTRAAQIEIGRRTALAAKRNATSARIAEGKARREARLQAQRERQRQSQVPYGASAQCSDGTYSFSAHRRGTCSHHGGVSVWY